MKKTIAILLAVVMLLGCISVAAVSAAETSVPGSVLITNDGKTYTANNGSIITYRVYVQTPEVVENGQFYITYPQNLLKVNDFNVPNTPGYMINYDENLANEIRFNFSNTSGCDLTTEKLLIEVMFEVVGDGEGSIAFYPEVMCNLKDKPVVEQSSFRESIDDADIYVPTTPTESTQVTEDTTPTQSTDDTNPTQPTDDTNPTEPTTESTENPTTAPLPTDSTDPTTPKPTVPAANNVGPGAKAEAAESKILQLKNDDDPKGSAFNLLQVKNTTTKNNSIKLSYKKPSKTKVFWIYVNKCGKKYRYEKVAETTSKSFTLKKLTKNTYYKFLVVAVDKKGKVVSTSKTIHVATKGGKNGNPSKIKITNANKAKNIKKGKTVTLKTKVTNPKNVKVKTHRPIAFESSNTKIATVSAKGKITAKKTGKCYIYAYTQNGVMAKVKVTVKK